MKESIQKQIYLLVKKKRIEYVYENNGKIMTKEQVRLLEIEVEKQVKLGIETDEEAKAKKKRLQIEKQILDQQKKEDDERKAIQNKRIK